MKRTAAAAALLAALTLAVFAGVRHHRFLHFDDDLFVTANPHVRDGVSAHGVRWALAADLLFDSPHADYWIPLTVLSRMLDVELYGLSPAGHHITNLALHAANVVLLFVLLARLTGEAAPSAFAAAVFAVHPLQVEPVAWVTARKDVLSGLMSIAALAAYVGWVRRPGPARLAGALAAFVLAALAKPMVAVPAVLLLLDAWPLGRVAGEGPWWVRWRPRVTEKAPWLAVAVLSAGATFMAHARGGHLAPLEVAPPMARVANALDAYATYLRQLLWPSGLAAFYPFVAGRLSAAPTMVAALTLAGLTWVAFRERRRRPWLIVGWGWFLVTVAPVSGLVQTGPQAHADRFMYFPLIGPAVAVAWLGANLAARWPRLRPVLAAAAIAVVAALAVASWRLVPHWHDTASLFARAVAVTTDNPLARVNLANALAIEGRLEEAERAYRDLLRDHPGHARARLNLAALLQHSGRPFEARAELAEAERRAPNSAGVLLERARFDLLDGDRVQAARRYREALRHEPRAAAAHLGLGNLLAAEGRMDQAALHFGAAVRIEPDNAAFRNNLGLALALSGHWDEARAQLEEALRLDPRQPQARTNLARALAGQGRQREAVAQYQEALRFNPGDADAARELQALQAAFGPEVR